MKNISLDKAKISAYAQIQKNLIELESNSPDEAINNIITQIPPDFFHQKDDLMIICQLFSYYARIFESSKKKNAIKLFEMIMDSIKTYLQDESSFFWNIFGSNYNFKYWMYREGLVSIDQIILSALSDETNFVIEYFLPEIISEKREIFEKELKWKYKKEFTEESLAEFKEKRSKYFKWLRESADYNDPIFTEIEKNQLRLSVKRDDIDTFQSILSKMNMSINSKIIESPIENFLRTPGELTLLEYAIQYNATKITKFLIMNEAKLNIQMIFYAINRNNYDLIHIFESKMNTDFVKEALSMSLAVWNNEMVEYMLNNYDFDFLYENNYDCKKDDAIKVANHALGSTNFMFLESTLFPFLNNNPEFVENNIYEMIMATFAEKSCFFLKEFLKFPGIDVNHRVTDLKITFLFCAIEEVNVRGVEILLNCPNIDVNCLCFDNFSPFQIACKNFTDMKIIKLLCDASMKSSDIKKNVIHSNALYFCIPDGNFYVVQYFVDLFPDMAEKFDFYLLFYICLSNKNFYTLKLIVKYYMEKKAFMSGEKLVNYFKIFYSQFNTYKKEFEYELKQTIHELNVESKD